MVRFEFIEKDRSLPWLLFIHGFAGNAGTWKNQIFEFKNEFNICLVDLPGHGNAVLSEEDMQSKNIFLKIAQEIIYRLKEKSVERINIVSFSMGTVVNYFMLQEEPEFCEKSIMVSPVCGGTKLMNLKCDLMSKIQVVLPFDFIVNRFVDFVLPKEPNADLQQEIKTACIDLGRDKFIFWYKSLKKYFNVMRDGSWNSLDNVFIVSGDRDLNLKPGVEYVVAKNSLQFNQIKDCGHLYPIERKDDFHSYLHNLFN